MTAKRIITRPKEGIRRLSKLSTPKTHLKEAENIDQLECLWPGFDPQRCTDWVWWHPGTWEVKARESKIQVLSYIKCLR